MVARSPPPNDSAAFAVATVANFCVIAFVVAAKALRDALFCDGFSRAELPAAMIAGALLSGTLALVAVHLFRVVGPIRGTSALLGLNVLALAAEYVLLPGAERLTAFALYLHISAVTAVLVSGLWLAINERFDPHALRHNVGRIGLGGTLGGVLGGALVDSVTTEVGARATLLLLATLSVLAAAVLLRFGRDERRPEAPLDSRAERRAQRPYLGRVACFVGLGALAASVADFAFKARVMDGHGSPEDLVRFFALFYGAVNVASFVLQTVVAPRLLETTNLGLGLAATPAALSVTSLLAIALPGLFTQALLKGADASFSTTLFRSAYEPLYTPIPTRAKRSLKTLIDVVVDEVGDATGSLVCWGLVVAFSGSAIASASLVVLLASLAGIVLARTLHRSYVNELARSLRTGTIALNETDVRDRTTRLTLSRTMDGMTRELLLQEIKQRAAAATAENSPPVPQPSSPGTAPKAPDEITARETRELSKAVEELRSSDPGRILTALAAPHRSLVSLVIPLVERSDVGSAAMATLASAGGISGQLSDALLDCRRHSPALRRRLARIIAHEPSAWAAAGLVAALDDPDFGVRDEVVRALEQIRRKGVALPITRDALVAAAGRELDRSKAGDERRATEHALTLLGFAFEPDAFGLASRALASENRKLSGTALEYLENVLPEPIRSRLLERIPEHDAARSKRSRHELLLELEERLGPTKPEARSAPAAGG